MVRRRFEDSGNALSQSLEPQLRRNGAEDMAGPPLLNTASATGDRPALISHQSNSLPSTPHHRSRAGTANTRSPSLGRNALNISPRASQPDQQRNLPAPRKVAGGCKYETGMARARRRVPYSLGPDKLSPEEGPLKSHLNPAEDEKLSGDMRELYDRLLPLPESVDRRRRFVKKLEKLLHDRWPEHSIAVNVFGSTGNDLGTTDSDVDICITTDWKELEHVCSLAELLAKHGMERVVCVSSAKVPIVKVWDPELEIACDMNVNNPIALENTELIRAYVGLDERVRPLAMIIKHWAKRRILNDAALGGTLSSYTWICMILNFLQTRKPPVLPSLQQQSHLPPKVIDGVNVAFDHDTRAFCNSMLRNKDSLASLMFQFFRYYGYELDFEESVMSVRSGRVLTKSEKGWHLLQDNRLCVEEPFNTTRNLGNTADDTSMRGIHIELRRAFKCISEGDLEACCEQYVAPPDEGRSSEIFLPPISRPVVPQAPAQTTKGGKNSLKSPRHTNNFNRGLNGSARRPSNPSNKGYLRNLPFQMTTQELQLQAQHQQHILHDQLFQQYQYLQAQEQELRMQLHQQALMQGRIPSTNSYPHIAFPSYTSSENGYDENNSSTVSASQSVMSAPIRQQRFGYPSLYMPATMPNYGAVTNPSSPQLATVLPDTRRYSRRTSVAQSAIGGSMRAQSQPARSLPSSLLSTQPVHVGTDSTTGTMGIDLANIHRLSTSSSTPNSTLSHPPTHRPTHAFARQDLGRRPAEYIGYYVGHSPPIPAYSRSAGISPVPSQVGLAIQNGGLSPRFSPQISSYSSTTASPPSRPMSVDYDVAELARQRGLSSPARPTLPDKRHGNEPLIMNGSTIDHADLNVPDSDAQDLEAPANFSASTSEDLAFDTPSSSDDLSQGQPEAPGRDIHQSLTSPRTVAKSWASTENRGVGTVNGGSHTNNDSSSGEEIDADREITPTEEPAPTASEILRTTTANIKSSLGRTNKLGDHRSGYYKTEDQLSPVREIPTPWCPPVENSADHATSKRAIEANSRSLHETSTPAALGKPNQKPDALHTRPNGTIAPSIPTLGSTTPVSGWQTQKKKKTKRSSLYEPELARPSSAVGQSLPFAEADKKGG